ncbi:BREX-2 system phosphatase PglZ [Paractinoplanes bogorensis]|uniref:BREX-2 system phosphatase PglZ n=1 Tax=Paractinoplanes bogorensis TaxID=1610840 RepID=UPI0027E00E38|nr:BREX-2 system phosphatase PglZ [Actinoplanes bogorensis]
MSVAQPAAIRRRIESWLADGKDDTPALALRSEPVWTGDDALTVNGTTVRVVPCKTPLAARAALHDRAEGERLVLLTSLSDEELGEGLLAHVSTHHVRTVQPWDVVMQMFNVGSVDRTLSELGRWVADALIDQEPVGGWSPVQGTVLTRDHALRGLAAELLGLERDEIDSAGLMEWSADATRVLRLMKHTKPLLDGLSGYLIEAAGPATVPIMAAARAGHGVDAVPLGLLVGVLWPEHPGSKTTEIAVARARLEPWFGGIRLTDQQASAFSSAAEVWVDRVVGLEGGAGEANRMLARAEAIAKEIDATQLLGGSNLLPAGFLQRMRDAAAAVRLAVPAAGIADARRIAAAQEALARLAAHRGGDSERLKTMQMAVRLLRWLATSDAGAPSTLYDALHREVREDGWVDRARLDIFAGDTDSAVAEALHLLHRAVDARRARHDQQFAESLAEATRAEAQPGKLCRVEDVLDRIVQPILDNGRRVLLLVMDGMSVAAATELAESLTRVGVWTELTPDGGPRTGVLAALPTITEVSRCSLFSGRIAVGQQAVEQKAFQERFPYGRILHKSKLRGHAGAAIAPDVSDALLDPQVALVAAVVNTIDDALDRSEPGTTVWGSETIPSIRDLLALADGRTVVIVSDHGHVVDRGPDGVYRASPSAENRWRPADPRAGEGELLFQGSRVAKGDGRVVLPWREELRYGPRKAGYHGGASAAEAVIPLLVLTEGDEAALPGWSPAPVASPSWWRESLTVDKTEAATVAPPAKRTNGKKAQAQSESLFDSMEPEPKVAAPKPAQAQPDLVAKLLASDIYRGRRDTRAPLADERAGALLRVLIAGGDRATMDTLAARANIPAGRIHGAITALRKQLQVEGYAVLSIDPDNVTVKLDRALLIEQFHLDAS